MNNTQSSSLDGINSYMFKSEKTELLPHLLFLYNMSIQQSSFPELWKVAKVIRLHKSGPTDDMNNCRPLSVIPTLSKALERLIYNQSVKYLTGNNVITDAQAGFREGCCMGTCLVDLLHNIYEEVHWGGACGTLFLDLTKAFDTADHQILVEKLCLLGFKNQSTCWFQSYLTGRRQVTKVNKSISEPMEITCEVPQGSILGPILFSCYIIDLPQHLLHCKSFLNADDTALLYRGRNIEDISNHLNLELEHVNNWFIANLLSSNAKKTKVMLFRSSHKYIDDNIQLANLDSAKIK